MSWEVAPTGSPKSPEARRGSGALQRPGLCLERSVAWAAWVRLPRRFSVRGFDLHFSVASDAEPLFTSLLITFILPRGTSSRSLALLAAALGALCMFWSLILTQVNGTETLSPSHRLPLLC